MKAKNNRKENNNFFMRLLFVINKYMTTGILIAIEDAAIFLLPAMPAKSFCETVALKDPVFKNSVSKGK